MDINKDDNIHNSQAQKIRKMYDNETREAALLKLEKSIVNKSQLNLYLKNKKSTNQQKSKNRPMNHHQV